MERSGLFNSGALDFIDSVRPTLDTVRGQEIRRRLKRDSEKGGA
jgi:hypothetical protein